MASAGSRTTLLKQRQKRNAKKRLVNSVEYFFVIIQNIDFQIKKLKLKETPASRRCFTSDELMKANAIGVNTANGCRVIKMREKVKHFCFCDGDMCNGAGRMMAPKTSAKITMMVALTQIFLVFYFFVC